MIRDILAKTIEGDKHIKVASKSSWVLKRICEKSREYWREFSKMEANTVFYTSALEN